MTVDGSAGGTHAEDLGRGRVECRAAILAVAAERTDGDHNRLGAVVDDVLVTSGWGSTGCKGATADAGMIRAVRDGHESCGIPAAAVVIAEVEVGAAHQEVLDE